MDCAQQRQKSIRSEVGAVTVDWVVLTAAIVGLGLAVMTIISGGVEDLSGEISVELASMEVGVDVSNGGAVFARNQWDARTGGVAGLET